VLKLIQTERPPLGNDVRIEVERLLIPGRL
jgi:hypothetical protein